MLVPNNVGNYKIAVLRLKSQAFCELGRMRQWPGVAELQPIAAEARWQLQSRLRTKAKLRDDRLTRKCQLEMGALRLALESGASFRGCA